MIGTCLRDKYRTVEDPQAGEEMRLYFEPGIQPWGRSRKPEDMHLLQAMVFNILWYTNFVADEHGIMEFQFDLLWRPSAEGSAQELAEALVAEPVAFINPDAAEDPRVIRDLYRP